MESRRNKRICHRNIQQLEAKSAFEQEVGWHKPKFKTRHFKQRDPVNVFISNSSIFCFLFKQQTISTSDFSTILNLPPGTHRIKFIVDDEWKCSAELSAATDAEGNLVNFLEVADEEQDELEGGQGEKKRLDIMSFEKRWLLAQVENL